MIHDAPSTASDEPMLRQGAAMFSAIAADLIVGGHTVIAPIDQRVQAMGFWKALAPPQEHFQSAPFTGRRGEQKLPALLQSLAATCDLIIIIAPESDGILAQCYRWLNEYQEKWWGGPQQWIELASDKNLTQNYLHDRGIATPSQTIGHNQQWVAKPVSGAGSEQVHVFTGTRRLKELQTDPLWRVEAFVPGLPVSVTVINPIMVDFTAGDSRPTPSPQPFLLLPPTGQRLDASKSAQVTNGGIGGGKESDHRPIGVYVGADYPLARSFAHRAEALARRTVGVLPTFSGYVGIDMVLADEGPDVVIEINPRVTMSYCHLPVEQRRSWIDQLS